MNLEPDFNGEEKWDIFAELRAMQFSTGKGEIKPTLSQDIDEIIYK